MKALLIILGLLFAIPSYSQSFYHKKMKKVKYPEVKNCAAMRPVITQKQRVDGNKLYRVKRHETKRMNRVVARSNRRK